MSWPLGYLKFFAPSVPVFNEEQEELLREFEQKNQQVWVALEPAEPGQPLVALGQLIRLEKPALGEIDVAVEKPYQRRGLGRLLTAMLYFVAQTEDLRALHVLVQSENEMVIEWLKRLGATPQYFRDELAELDWPVYPEAGLFPPNDSSRQFQVALDQIKEACARTE
jgi:ribosomal protein S18 acetylase RimI-like enzyme